MQFSQRREIFRWKTNRNWGRSKYISYASKTRRGVSRARAHDTAFYLCRPFCGTTERHLVFMATPRATSSNPPSHPHADTNPLPFHPRNSSLLAEKSFGEIRVHSFRDENERLRFVLFTGRSVDYILNAFLNPWRTAAIHLLLTPKRTRSSATCTTFLNLSF